MFEVVARESDDVEELSKNICEKGEFALDLQNTIYCHLITLFVDSKGT